MRNARRWRLLVFRWINEVTDPRHALSRFTTPVETRSAPRTSIVPALSRGGQWEGSGPHGGLLLGDGWAAEDRSACLWLGKGRADPWPVEGRWRWGGRRKRRGKHRSRSKCRQVQAAVSVIPENTGIYWLTSHIMDILLTRQFVRKTGILV